MPELPEVETTLCGIQPHIQNQHIKNIIVRQASLRWSIPHDIQQKLNGKQIQQVTRRAKYILFQVESGAAILHLGMSGSVRIITKNIPVQKHDHFDIQFVNGVILRFTDPRRFGAFLWTDGDPLLHKLLKNLGLEPLDRSFSGEYLFLRARGKTTRVKSFIMDNKIVVGVGNIYAAEALFRAGIHPATSVNKLTRECFNSLVAAIKIILRHAIKRGGTTLKDFVNSDGKPGYFSNQLKVYGRAGLPCIACSLPLTSLRIGQRSTVFCEQCQVWR